MSTRRTCSLPGCNRPHKAHGWCDSHYRRWRRIGDPQPAEPFALQDRRFYTWPESLLRRLEVVGSCVEFTGFRDRHGYGNVWRDGRTLKAHRAMWELMVGPLDPAIHMDHLCRNPACVNPGHLEPVTPAENNRRGESPSARNARKTHCIHGHPFDEQNTYWWRGKRDCRACHRDRRAGVPS